MESKLNAAERRSASALAAIFGLRMLGLFLIMPVLAVYGTVYPDYSPMLVGLAIGAYGLTQALLQIPMGMLSDRLGRKPVILFGLTVFFVGSVVAAQADTLTWVVVGRTLQGAGAIAGAVLALAADSAREEQRPKVMAFIGMGIGLSFVLALIIAPILGEHIGISGLFWLTAGLTFLSILAVLTALPKPLHQTHSRDVLPVPEEMKGLFKNGQLMRLNLGVLVLHLVLTAWFVVLPSALVEAGLAGKYHSWLYLPAMLLSFAIMVPWMLRCIKQQKIIQGVQGAIVVMVVAVTLFLLTFDQLWLIMLAVLVFFVGFNFLESNLPALLSQHAPAGSKGSASGIYTTFQFMGAFLGGSLGGVIAQLFGLKAVMLFGNTLLLCWFIISLGMQQIARTLRITIPLEKALNHAQCNELTSLLKTQSGVEDVVVIGEEQVIYLKINKQIDAQATLNELVTSYTQKQV